MSLHADLKALYIADHPELNPDQRCALRMYLIVLLGLVESWGQS